MAEQNGGKSGFTRFLVWTIVLFLFLYLLLGPIFNIVSRWKETDKWSFEGSDLNPLSSLKSISKAAETFTGKSCKTNDKCASEEGKPNCVENKCQECGANDQCAGNADGQICFENECVQCGTIKDCPESNFACEDNKCVECTEDEQCADNGKGKACVENKCVLCDDDEDCGAGSVCTNKNTCVECIKDSDCKDKPDKNKCLSDQNICVQCRVDSDCGGGVCILSDNTCKECRDNTQCADGFECESNACVETTFHSMGGWWTIGIGGVLFVGVIILMELIGRGKKKTPKPHSHGSAPAAPRSGEEYYR